MTSKPNTAPAARRARADADNQLFGPHEDECFEQYTARLIRESRQRIADGVLRPTKAQAGHADLPLFQTDIEDFTRR